MDKCRLCKLADDLEKAPLPYRKLTHIQMATIESVARLLRRHCIGESCAVQESGSDEVSVRQEASVSETVGETN